MRNMLMRRIRRVLCPAVIFLLVLALFSMTVRAASGTVYTCVIHPCYAHPVTGEIEDAGGSASTATGQGMVEGALGSSGILEVTDSGEYYLTVRMSLMDYSSGHSFQVQEVGGSGWSSTGVEETGSGSDDSGATADMRIQVPSESCVVRCSMYVEPMGRDVIFYFYPSDYTEGNTTDMAAAVVTESSSSGQNDTSAESSTGQETVSAQESSAGQSDAAAQESSADAGGVQEQSSAVQSAGTDGGTASGQAESSDLSGAQGLSLSTAPDSVEEESADTADIGPLTWVLILTVSITLSGAILMLLGAYLIYVFRKNWNRWGGTETTLSEEDWKEEEKIYLAEGFGLPDEPEEGVWDSEGVLREPEEGEDLDEE